jgi:hypothetical protein
MPEIDACVKADDTFLQWCVKLLAPVTILWHARHTEIFTPGKNGVKRKHDMAVTAGLQEALEMLSAHTRPLLPRG